MLSLGKVKVTRIMGKVRLTLEMLNVEAHSRHRDVSAVIFVFEEVHDGRFAGVIKADD